MTAMQPHDHIVRQAFTQQADAYATTASIADPTRLAKLVQAVHPSANSRLLDVATGPGYVAIAFASVCREVVGVDLTEAPLAIADKRRQEQGLTNLHFRTAHANHLPFEDGAFDRVVCRFAFHHFENPGEVLAEMSRVCRSQGLVVVEDLIVSEHHERATYQNRFEHLRDPSHTAAFPLSQLLALFTKVGLEIESLSTDHLAPDMEQWLANAQTPEDRAHLVRKMLEQDRLHDLSGTHPFYDEAQRLRFYQRTATVIGRNLC